MTIREGNELIEILKIEIENGIDVEFNTEWIRLLRLSIVNALKFNK